MGRKNRLANLIVALLLVIGFGVIGLYRLNMIEYSDDRYSDHINQESEFKIMTYNVLLGLNEPERYEAFVDYIKNETPDVLALEELNDFRGHDLEVMAESYGHQYVIQLKESGYPVGITSKYPIELIKKMRIGLHHGALHVKIEGIHFLVVHLSPKSAKKRMDEVVQILDYLERWEISNNQDIVILGDFNTHSIEDQDYLVSKNIMDFYNEKNLVDGHLDYSVTNQLIERGYVDGYRNVNQEDLKLYTYPTDNIGERGERIDFIFLSDSLKSYLTESDVHINEATQSISDHFPVSVILTKKKE